MSQKELDLPVDDNASDDPNSLSKHHRKLQSHGGNNSKRNISHVRLWEHKAWHVLYRDLEPKDIIAAFTQDYEVYGTDFIKSPLMKELHQGWANNTSEKIKRTQAWYALFTDMTLEDIVHDINTRWLDPDYEILIGMVRVKTVQLITKAKAK